MTFRTGWIFAGITVFALLSGAAAYSQATDAQSSASVRAEAPAPRTDATSAASQKEQGTDATSAASERAAAPAPAAPRAARRPGPAWDPSVLVRTWLYNAAQGPLLVAAFVIFVLGMAWRLSQFRRMTRPVSAPLVPPRARFVAAGSQRADVRFLTASMSAPRRFAFLAARWIRQTAVGTSPVTSMVSALFHVGLFFVPLFLPGHNMLFRQKYHAGLPTLPEPVMDRLTILLLALAAFFFLRRVLYPRVRALSAAQDYLVLLMVIAPFFTGLVAYHHWMDYRTIMALHMTAADLLIGAIVFTKLGHMPFLLYARLFVSTERSWRPAKRRW